jgi:hypothetical protein
MDKRSLWFSEAGTQLASNIDFMSVYRIQKESGSSKPLISSPEEDIKSRLEQYWPLDLGTQEKTGIKWIAGLNKQGWIWWVNFEGTVPIISHHQQEIELPPSEFWNEVAANSSKTISGQLV